MGAQYFYDRLGRRTYVRPSAVSLQGIRYDYAGAFLKKVCRGVETAGGSCSIPIVDDVGYDSLGRRDIVHLPPTVGDRDFVYADDVEDLDANDDETRHLKKEAFEIGGAETASMAYTCWNFFHSRRASGSSLLRSTRRRFTPRSSPVETWSARASSAITAAGGWSATFS
jgi:hypothetical protein